MQESESKFHLDVDLSTAGMIRFRLENCLQKRPAPEWARATFQENVKLLDCYDFAVSGIALA